jgi:hypothetical protein
LICGYATLNSVRAAFNTASTTGLSPTANYAAWGYSGGAIGTELAAELQPTYAPELNFSGITIGGLTPNITRVIFEVNKGIFYGLSFSGLVGLGEAYPLFAAYIDQHLINSTKAEFMTIGNAPSGTTMNDGAFKDVFSYFDIAQNILYDPISQSIFANSSLMGLHRTPQAPLFFYDGALDEISPVGDTTALFDEYCSRGKNATIQYQINVAAEHDLEAIEGSPAAFAWLKDRLNGVPVDQRGCTGPEEVFITDLYPATLESFGTEIAAALVGLIGGVAGS